MSVRCIEHVKVEFPKIERGPATRRLPALATEPQRKHNREGRSVAPSSIGPKERMSRRGGLRLRASAWLLALPAVLGCSDPSADNYNPRFPNSGVTCIPAPTFACGDYGATNFDSTAGPCRAPRTGLAHTSGAAGHLGCPVDRSGADPSSVPAHTCRNSTHVASSPPLSTPWLPAADDRTYSRVDARRHQLQGQEEQPVHVRDPRMHRLCRRQLRLLRHRPVCRNVPVCRLQRHGGRQL